MVVVMYHCDKNGDEEDMKDTREDAFLERRCRRTDIIIRDFFLRAFCRGRILREKTQTFKRKGVDSMDDF